MLVPFERCSSALPRYVFEHGAVDAPGSRRRIDAIESECQRLGVVRPVSVDQDSVLGSNMHVHLCAVDRRRLECEFVVRLCCIALR